MDSKYICITCITQHWSKCRKFGYLFVPRIHLRKCPRNFDFQAWLAGDLHAPVVGWHCVFEVTCFQWEWDFSPYSPYSATQIWEAKKNARVVLDGHNFHPNSWFILVFIMLVLTFVTMSRSIFRIYWSFNACFLQVFWSLTLQFRQVSMPSRLLGGTGALSYLCFSRKRHHWTIHIQNMIFQQYLTGISAKCEKKTKKHKKKNTNQQTVWIPNDSPRFCFLSIVALFFRTSMTGFLRRMSMGAE